MKNFALLTLFTCMLVSISYAEPQPVLNYSCKEYNAMYAQLPEDPQGPETFETLAKTKEKEINTFLKANILFVTQNFMAAPNAKPDIQQVGTNMEKFRVLCEKYPEVSYNVLKDERGYVVVADVGKYDYKEIQQDLSSLGKLPPRLMFPSFLVSSQLGLVKN